MFPNETSFAAQAKAYKPFITNNDALQAQQLIQLERRSPGLAYGSSPTLNSVLRWALALDDVAGLRILEQKERRGSGEQIAR